jgi:ketosteroid isomerase-like protein
MLACARNISSYHAIRSLWLVDKGNGKVLQDAKNRHLHILKREPDGTWKTWRMMVNST